MKKAYSDTGVRGWLSRALLAAAPAGFLAFTVVFIGPLDILNSNRAYVPFAAGKLILPLLGLVLLVTLALAALLGLARGRLYKALLGGLFGVALMLYLQGLLLNGHLASLDGSAFDWRDDVTGALVNLAIWLAAVAACVVLSLRFFDTARLAVLVLCAACFASQTAGLVAAWRPADESLNYQLDGSHQMELSSKKNFIVITFDQMSPLVFEQAIADDPQMQEQLKDFEYFNNMSAEYSLTFPSLCFLMTHERYDTTKPTLDYFDRAWSSESCESFFDTLHRQNYEVKLCVEANYAAYDAEHMLGKADNVVEAGALRVDGGLLADVLELSLYRYCPVMLKTPFCISTGQVAADAHYDNIESLRLAADYYDAVKEGVTTQDEQNCFAWYHVDGAHFPFTVGYDGLPLGYEAEETEENRVAQLHGYLLAAMDFLDRLKALGLYDDATIILSADHGFYDCFQAAFLIKQPGQSFETMRVNAAPVAQEDIMATILDSLGEDYSDYGTTVYDWSEGDSRERSTNIWIYMDGYPEAPWIGNINQWETVAHGMNRYNVFGVLTYNGDREALREKEILLFYSHTADEILPLYDSFY